MKYMHTLRAVLLMDPSRACIASPRNMQGENVAYPSRRRRLQPSSISFGVSDSDDTTSQSNMFRPQSCKLVTPRLNLMSHQTIGHLSSTGMLSSGTTFKSKRRGRRKKKKRPMHPEVRRSVFHVKESAPETIEPSKRSRMNVSFKVKIPVRNENRERIESIEYPEMTSDNVNEIHHRMEVEEPEFEQRPVTERQITGVHKAVEDSLRYEMPRYPKRNSRKLASQRQTERRKGKADDFFKRRRMEGLSGMSPWEDDLHRSRAESTGYESFRARFALSSSLRDHVSTETMRDELGVNFPSARERVGKRKTRPISASVVQSQSKYMDNEGQSGAGPEYHQVGMLEADEEVTFEDGEIHVRVPKASPHGRKVKSSFEQHKHGPVPSLPLDRCGIRVSPIQALTDTIFRGETKGVSMEKIITDAVRTQRGDSSARRKRPAVFFSARTGSSGTGQQLPHRLTVEDDSEEPVICVGTRVLPQPSGAIL